MSRKMGKFNSKDKVRFKGSVPELTSDENWLISYADMMTLLFGLFVIISAFSTPDPEKLEALKMETAKSTGVKYTRPLSKLTEDLKTVLKTSSMENEIKISSLTNGIKLTASSTKFFAPAMAQLQPNAKKIIINLGKILKGQTRGFKVIVEGHTDDLPINSKAFPSNWELSLRRASEVVRLFEKEGVKHSALRPIGLADIEPKVDISKINDPRKLKEARQINRRIVIRVLKQIR